MKVSCFALEHHTMTQLVYLKHYPHDQRTNHGDTVCPTPAPTLTYSFPYSFCFLKIKEDFGFQFRDEKTTILDMGYSLIDSGFIKATPKYQEMKTQQSTASN